MHSRGKRNYQIPLLLINSETSSVLEMTSLGNHDTAPAHGGGCHFAARRRVQCSHHQGCKSLQNTKHGKSLGIPEAKAWRSHMSVCTSLGQAVPVNFP